jgi:ZIP family zinc transporter
MLWVSLAAGLALAAGGAARHWWRSPGLGPTAALLGFAGGVLAWAALGRLLPAAARDAGYGPALLYAAAGLTLVSLVERLIPHHTCGRGSGDDDDGGDAHRDCAQLQALPARSALMVAMVVTAHNLLEGATVTVSYAEGPGLGIGVAMAAGLHNLPIGMALGLPGAPLRARAVNLGMLALSGLATPLGAVSSAWLLPLLGKSLPHALAFVGGTMVALAAWELLPRALSAHRGWAAAAVLAGAVVARLIG